MGEGFLLDVGDIVLLIGARATHHCRHGLVLEMAHYCAVQNPLPVVGLDGFQNKRQRPLGLIF